ncbi:MAG: hypothetical protein HQ485_02840 [Acidobacteria bacterium]|jgi:uncharacterized membrane protein|nr:hypothetical protein [Acidobacteriota bacterium]
MTDDTSPPALRGVIRMGLMTTAASLGMGLVLSLVVSGPAAAAAAALAWAGLALLVALPVLTVIGVLIDEWRRREWSFVLAAVAALVLLGFAIVRKMQWALGA